MEEVPGNILKYVVGSKSLQQHIFVINDFEILIVETDYHSKLEQLRKNIDKSFTVKTGEILNVQKINIFVIEEKIIWMYLLKR